MKWGRRSDWQSAAECLNPKDVAVILCKKGSKENKLHEDAADAPNIMIIINISITHMHCINIY